MTTLALAKISDGTLIAIDDDSCEYIENMAQGDAITVTPKKLNNPAFHRKLFALFKLAYDAWEAPNLEYKGEVVAKNFDQFRRDITILAGFYETTVNLKGEVRLIAKSLSFDKMDNDGREKVYNAVINVILARILKDKSREELDDWVEKVMQFDGGRF